MATICSHQLSLDGTPVAAKATRKSYTREYKLQVVKHYRDPNNTLYATSKAFNVSTKCILLWAEDEEKYTRALKGRGF